MTKPPRVMFCQPSPADGYEPSDGTPDPDSAVVQMALAVADLDSAIEHVKNAAHDDARLCEFLAVIRRALRGQRDALEAEVKSAQP